MTQPKLSKILTILWFFRLVSCYTTSRCPKQLLSIPLTWLTHTHTFSIPNQTYVYTIIFIRAAISPEVFRQVYCQFSPLSSWLLPSSPNQCVTIFLSACNFSQTKLSFFWTVWMICLKISISGRYTYISVSPATSDRTVVPDAPRWPL